MNELAELEQVERIKKWCRDYGLSIVAGIIFAVMISMVWHYWRQTQENNLVLASIAYQNLLNNLDQSKSIAHSLIQKYPYAPYTSLAALQIAKQAINQNDLAEAEKQLIWVTQHGKNGTLRAVARVRLARVLLAENQPEHALKVLDENDNTVYQPLVFEEKGNIFLHLKDSSNALQNYLAAEKAFSKNAIDQPLLSMQINSLN